MVPLRCELRVDADGGGRRCTSQGRPFSELIREGENAAAISDAANSGYVNSQTVRVARTVPRSHRTDSRGLDVHV